MFSLIITLIAIALVAALALATLYYGGPVFNEGSERALAAKLDAQGQQIMGALELYNAENGHYPATLNDLVSTNYLKSIPTAAAEQAVLAAAFAATGTWSLSSPGKPVIVMKPVSLATCQAFNKTNLGVAGVLQQAHSTQLKQCIGTDVNNLMIVQPKSATDLVFVSTDPAAVVQIGAVLTSAIPPASDKTSNGWLDTPSGVVTPVGTVSLSTATLDFGAATVGVPSTPKAVLVQNTGTVPVTFAATAANASAPYTVESSTCNGATLAPDASCTIDVGFNPTLPGTFSGAAYKLTVMGASSSLGVVSLSGSATPLMTADACLSLANSGSLPFTGTQGDYEAANTQLVNNCARPLQVFAADGYYNNYTWARGYTGYGTNVRPNGSVFAPNGPMMDLQATTMYMPSGYGWVEGDWLPGIAWWDAEPDPYYLDTAPRPDELPAPSLAANALTLTVKIYLNSPTDPFAIQQGNRLVVRADTFSAPGANNIPVRMYINSYAFSEPGAYDLNGQGEFFVRFADEPTAPFVRKVIPYYGLFQH